MTKIIGIDSANIVKLNGSAMGGISKVSGVTTSTPGIIQTNLNIQFDIQDSSSYPGTGTSLVDLKGNNNGTLQASPLYSTHLGAKSLRFNGNSWVSFASNVVSTNWTVSYWISYYASNTYYHRIWGMGGYRMEIAFTRNSLYIYDGGWFNTGINLNSTSEWHNLVVTYNNSPRTITVFKDGIQVYTTRRGRTMNTWARLFNSSDNRRAKGYLGELLFYNNNLTPAEVLNNYNVKKSIYGR